MGIEALLGLGNHKGDPDYIVTVDGSPIITEDIAQWTVVDDEETSSSIVVTLDNFDQRHSGKYKVGASLCLRFGYAGYLVGKSEFPIMAIKEQYATSGCTVTITGKDPTQKQGGNKHSGDTKTKDPKKAIENIMATDGRLKKTEVKGDFPKEIKNERNKPAPILFFNETLYEMRERLMPFGAAKEEAVKGIQDVYPEEPGPPEGFKGETYKGDAQSGGAHGSDKQRGNNAGGKGGQNPVTATITLVGYPELKAKQNIDVANVGPAASGTYYVKQCRHQVTRGQSYKTTATLIKGGSGKGGAGTISGCSPVVGYANIYGSGGYVGPRKYNEPAQAKLFFGDGGPIETFDFSIAPQPNRGGGKDKGVTKGHDLTKKAEPLNDDRVKKTQPGGSSGGNTGGNSSSSSAPGSSPIMYS